MGSVKPRLVPLLAVTAILIAAATAIARPIDHRGRVAHCSSVRVNRFLHASPHGLFGAFSLTARGTRCSTARTVASKYVHDPAAVNSPAHGITPISGWACAWRDNNTVAQQVSVTCTKPAARITFADRIPSG
jgi:hypothetical protein